MQNYAIVKHYKWMKFLGFFKQNFCYLLTKCCLKMFFFYQSYQLTLKKIGYCTVTSSTGNVYMYCIFEAAILCMVALQSNESYCPWLIGFVSSENNFYMMLKISFGFQSEIQEQCKLLKIIESEMRNVSTPWLPKLLQALVSILNHLWWNF